MKTAAERELPPFNVDHRFDHISETRLGHFFQALHIDRSADDRNLVGHSPDYTRTKKFEGISDNRTAAVDLDASASWSLCYFSNER
jgi:hypothetical protein